MIVNDLVPPAVPDPSRSRKGTAAALPSPADVRCHSEQVASITSRPAELA
jgi:hypothetical protein